MDILKAPITVLTPDDIFIECPFCGMNHKHGNSENRIDLNDYGSRVPHCRTKPDRAQYILVAVETTYRTKDSKDSVVRKAWTSLNRKTKHPVEIGDKHKLLVEYKGELITLKQLSRLCNLPYQTLYARIVVRGWEVDRAVVRRGRNYDI